ncbi:MAG TPA: hypothetical protein VHD32_10860 [Candidatus Didemnitutus sp.]|nr:hypothetical protein [Candidatus Didemnitutus sp.]
MKTRALVPWVFSAMLAVSLSGATPSQELSRELHRTYHFDSTPKEPVALSTPAVEADEDDDIIRLAPFHVTAVDTLRDEFAAQAEREQKAREAERFSFLHGGRIAALKFGGGEVAVGLWPEISQLDPVVALQRRELKVSLDILRVRW